MVPISLASIVPSHVGNAIDHAVCRAAPSKTQRPSVEAGILPSLAGVVLFRNISPQTASPVPPKNVGYEQRGSVEKPMPTVGCLADGC